LSVLLLMRRTVLASVTSYNAAPAARLLTLEKALPTGTGAQAQKLLRSTSGGDGPGVAQADQGNGSTAPGTTDDAHLHYNAAGGAQVSPFQL
jgi:hypothetical protein